MSAYSHLMVINDGEEVLNELHTDDVEAAKSLLLHVSRNEDFEKHELLELFQEIDEEAAQADYPEGVSPKARLDPEDYFEGLVEFMANRGHDVFLSALDEPQPVQWVSMEDLR